MPAAAGSPPRTPPSSSTPAAPPPSSPTATNYSRTINDPTPRDEVLRIPRVPPLKESPNAPPPPGPTDPRSRRGPLRRHQRSEIAQTRRQDRHAQRRSPRRRDR